MELEFSAVDEPAMLERGAALAEHGIDFYDASFVFRDVEETLYFDRCHFEPPGMILLVDSITERLDERIGRGPNPPVGKSTQALPREPDPPPG